MVDLVKDPEVAAWVIGNNHNLHSGAEQPSTSARLPLNIGRQIWLAKWTGPAAVASRTQICQCNVMFWRDSRKRVRGNTGLDQQCLMSKQGIRPQTTICLCWPAADAYPALICSYRSKRARLHSWANTLIFLLSAELTVPPCHQCFHLLLAPTYLSCNLINTFLLAEVQLVIACLRQCSHNSSMNLIQHCVY
jgi:hypothetical protein